MTTHAGFTTGFAPDGSPLRILGGLSRYGITEDRRAFSRAMANRYKGPGAVTRGKWTPFAGYVTPNDPSVVRLMLVNDDKKNVNTSVDELWDMTWGIDERHEAQETAPAAFTDDFFSRNDAPLDGPFWVLFNPFCEKPPRVRFRTEEEAREVAFKMWDRHGGTFCVMEHKGSVSLATRVVEEPKWTLVGG